MFYVHQSLYKNLKQQLIFKKKTHQKITSNIMFQLPIWIQGKVINNMIYQEKIWKATANCLLAVADLYWSLDQIQMQPPSKLAIAWARSKRIIAATPSLNAWWLGYLQSNSHIFIGFSCYHIPKLINKECRLRRMRGSVTDVETKYLVLSCFCLNA